MKDKYMMKGKYIFGGIIISIFFVIMAFLLSQSSIAYENDFNKLKNSTKTIRATGAWDKSGGVEIDKENNKVTFWIVDNNNVRIKVVYNGMLPNNFEAATSVVVTGKYRDDVFYATDILTKCPSKYETQYEENLK